MSLIERLIDGQKDTAVVCCAIACSCAVKKLVSTEYPVQVCEEKTCIVKRICEMRWMLIEQ